MEKDKQNGQPMDSPEMQALMERAKNNKNTVIMLCILVVLIVFGLILYFFIANSGSAKADEAAGRADIATNDSIALVLYKEAADMGYKSGNRSAAEVGIRLYNEGNYAEAAEYLKKADLGDKIAAAGVYTLLGDCYVNLDKYADALKYYDKAVSKADKNPTIVPVVLVKKANVYRAQENYKAEYEALRTIVDQYPDYVRTSQADIRKYMERAKASCGE